MNRYRFAPSPTGHLHIGGARTALYNYLMARKTAGRFVLRIEDTDRERSTQEYIHSILEAMDWLALDYDEGPFYQTKRTELYQQHLDKLLEEKKAYRCFCTPEALEQKRKQAMAEGKKPKYDGTCRHLDPEAASRDTRSFCVRFKSSDEGVTVVEDLIRGHIEFNNDELDDLILARSNGTPTYNFVVVIDDLTMGVTDVIRGDDHLNNTPRQIQLYRAFDYPIPRFAHVPMILGSDKKRLSKRHGATSVLAYRDAGYLPEALLNYLLRLGWAYGDQEIFSREDMLKFFDIANVGKASAVFNADKLLWLNGYWIRTSDPERLLELTRPFLEKMNLAISDSSYAKEALLSCREKVKTLVELAEMSAFYFRDGVVMEEKARKKGLDEKGQATLQEILPELLGLESWTHDSVENFFTTFGEKRGLKLGQIAQPLRAALSGSTVSPGIYDVVVILGKQRVQKRIEAVLQG